MIGPKFMLTGILAFLSGIAYIRWDGRPAEEVDYTVVKVVVLTILGGAVLAVVGLVMTVLGK